MRPGSDSVRLALLESLPEGAELCVAFSGGRDSTVLLHALARLRKERRFTLRAVHVDHGIQAAARDWAAHCVATAARLAVPCEAVPVTVRNDRGKGLEAEAREARYGALRQLLRPGEWLLTAHHADDQLETVLLHLLRGSGVSGLAGIPRDTAFGPGRLRRPLLDVSAESLAAYARELLAPGGLGWLTDPMNADVAYDRGFVRHEVAPVLRRRFPAAAGAIGRTAALAGEAAGLLEELARADARDGVVAHRVSLAAIRGLGPARQRNLVRVLARDRGWATPPERRLREGLAQLLAAAPGRQPVLAWGGHEIRRFREHLHLLDVAVPAPGAPALPAPWHDGQRLNLGGIRGELDLQRGAGAGGLDPGVVADGLEVVFRSGGERVRPGSDRHHRTLKYLFQSRGIVPWMRGHVPLVFVCGQLAAVADIWIADWAAAAPGDAGLQIVWTGHAPIW
ncbi:MAG: tRNA lysidine(34) synthetase TilS [Chromatiales bacterium]|nr:tRNA lysidine(34) synthetase TilS [Chromatiales bacterium]